jgi:hypothetical protein
MDDFLHQLRNNGNARRFDRPRKTYDGNQYNNDKRRPPNQNRYNSRPQAESEHLPIIRKTLEEIAANQARQLTIGERRAVAEERKAEAMESIAAWLGQQNAPQMFVQDPETVAQTPDSVPEEVQASPEPPAAQSYQRSELVDMINSLRKKGLSYEKIALHMQNEKVPTLSGRGQWRGQSVYRLCQV